MKLGILFSVVLALLPAPAARAGDAPVGAVSGRVVDPAGHPVQYVAVVLQNEAGQPVQRAASDANGEFRFEKLPGGNYRVSYGLVGEDPTATGVVAVDAAHPAAGVGQLTLAAGPVRMDQLDVSAQRQAFYNSIDRKVYNVGTDLRSVGGTASDLLQNIPSVQVDVDGNVSLRGDSSVLVLVNGKPSTLMSSANRADMLAQMPADSIERIDVITNPSAKYKPDGTAGIINLTLKKGTSDGSAVSIRASLGNESRSNLSLSANRKLGDYTVSSMVNYRQDSRDRFVDETRSHFVAGPDSLVSTVQHSSEHMRPLTRIVQAGIDGQPTEHDKVGLTGSYTLRTFFRNASVSNLSRDAAGTPTQDYDRLRADAEWQKTTEVTATYEHDFPGEDHQLAIEVKRDRHWEQEDNEYTNVYRVPAAISTKDFTLMKPTETGLELTADYTKGLANDGKLEAGYDLESDKADTDFRSGFLDPLTNAIVFDAAHSNRFIYRDSISAVYVTYGRPIGKFGFLAGLRGEGTNAHTDQVTARLTDRDSYYRLHPSLHLSYNLTETQQLQANYSHRVHRPESEDLNPFPEYQDPFNLRAGNPHLRPEETHSIEAGYQYRKDDTTYLATLYLRDTYRAFTTVTRYIDAATLLTTQENVASHQAEGLELAVTRPVGDSLTLNLSGNAFSSRIDASNLGFAGQRTATAWNTKFNLDWRLDKADLVQVNANYTGRRLTPQGYQLPTEVVNLGWKHDLSTKNLSFILTVSDVFNSLKDRTVINTPTLQDTITRRRSSRIIYAGFTYKYGQAGKKTTDLQYDSSL